MGKNSIVTGSNDDKFVVEDLYKVIKKHLDKFSEKNMFEQIFMDNLSTDNTLKILEKIAKKSQESTNSTSPFKTVRSICKYYILNNLIIRKAHLKDLLQVLAISNDLTVRKTSFSSSTITLTNHKKWFLQKNQDKNCIFLVIEFKKKIIAQLRLDIDATKAFISISVSRYYKNFGLGRLLVKNAIEILYHDNPKVHEIIAEIKPENEESIQFFKSLSFMFSKETKVHDYKAFEFILKV